MFALKGAKSASAGHTHEAAYGGPFGGFVLPRALRRPARLITRLIGGDIAVPRHATALLNGGFLLCALGYGVAVGGHAPVVVQALTGHTGFAIDTVEVVGNTETSEIDVLQQLGLNGWTSLVGFDADDARTRLSDLPWVEDVSVRKIYPRTLEIRIDERSALAIWQHDRELVLIEENGAPIAPFVNAKHADLPLVIGLGAATEAKAFLDKVAAYPQISSRVKGYIRIAERRWDLRLDNGITVKLPVEGEDGALAELAELERNQGVLSRDIAAVDLRFDDRLLLQLTPEAAVARQASLEEQEKARKKAGKRI